jgi:hypothetical protein
MKLDDDITSVPVGVETFAKGGQNLYRAINPKKLNGL